MLLCHLLLVLLLLDLGPRTSVNGMFYARSLPNAIPGLSSLPRGPQLSPHLPQPGEEQYLHSWKGSPLLLGCPAPETGVTGQHPPASLHCPQPSYKGTLRMQKSSIPWPVAPPNPLQPKHFGFGVHVETSEQLYLWGSLYPMAHLILA